MSESDPSSDDFDAVVVGAGFAGMYMLHRLQARGLRARVYEAGTSVGGTWYWNRYPGARCDVPSLDYSYSFSEELQQEWQWTERYPSQPEILAYANHVADRFDLRRDIQFETRVVGAQYHEEPARWTVRTDRGDRVTARFLITAAGCLSAPAVPDFKGLESFEGSWYHTGLWPKEGVDFSGKRVAIIGTGSSGIQAMPVIAREADHVCLLQRTANYVTLAHNPALDAEAVAHVKAEYPEYRERARQTRLGISIETPEHSALEVSPEERERIYERRWAVGDANVFVTSFTDIYSNLDANETAAEFVRAKIRSIVNDPVVAELLTPRDHAFGAKRLCISEEYYEAFNRDNVTLVDVKQRPIEEITPTGIRVGDDVCEVDVIVFSTGYDAITGPILNMNIRNSAGLTLNEKWVNGPVTYLGLATKGFPNLLMITGPGSPSVLVNVIAAIEQHVEWISDTIAFMDDNGIATIEPTEQAEQDWGAEVARIGARSFISSFNAWYMGANIPGKPRVVLPYAGGLVKYRRFCQQVVADNYAGFVLSGSSS
ncbi:MAG: cyclohexanone monooxygenase [Acidimicrobiales bacterium]|nr:cyclohexanone monooxygenase [Acidimicrobiales bacterium]